MQIQTVVPAKELLLSHRAFHIRTSCEGHVVAAATDGQVSVIGPSRSVEGNFCLKEKLNGISLHPKGHQLAVVVEGGVRLVNLRGETIDKMSGPVVDAWFDSQSNLWVASRASVGNGFEVAIHEGDNLARRLVHVNVEDPFGDSHFVFPDSPVECPVPIWIAAGQNGQVVDWIEQQDDELIVNTLDDFEQCSPPVVSPNGEEFLMPVGLNELVRFDLLSMEQMGTLQLPTESLVTSCLYLDDIEALVTDESGLAYRVDVSEMAIVSQIEVAGHKPRKIGELYPGLDDAGLCSDLFQVVSAGRDGLMSFHKVLPDPDFRQLASVAWWQ